MKRRAQGKTRTGAIPFCMAEASPQRAFIKRIGVFFEITRRGYAETMAREVYGSNSGLGLPYVDSVALFATSHPPAGDE